MNLIKEIEQLKRITEDIESTNNRFKYINKRLDRIEDCLNTHLDYIKTKHLTHITHRDMKV